MSDKLVIKNGAIIESLSSGTVALDIQGINGQLLSITDSLTGDIFAVSDISGMPIMTVNSNGTVTIDGSLVLTSGTISATLANTLTRGSYLTGSNYNGSAATTWAVDADTAATANKIVARDANGYIYGVYFNSNRGDETSTAASYIYDSGDGWMRKKTLANTKTEIVTSAAVIAGLGYTPYNSTNPSAYITSSGVNFTNLSANSSVGTGSNQVAAGDHNHSGVYAPVNQTMYIGTTAVTINRASASLALTGITSIDGSAAKLTTPRSIGDVSFDGSGSIVPERLLYKDTRGTNFNPNTYAGITLHLKTNTTDGLSDGNTHHGVINVAQWSDISGGKNHQLGLTDNNNIWLRQSTSSTTWSNWEKLYHTGNLTLPHDYYYGGDMYGNLYIYGGFLSANNVYSYSGSTIGNQAYMGISGVTTMLDIQCVDEGSGSGIVLRDKWNYGGFSMHMYGWDLWFTHLSGGGGGYLSAYSGPAQLNFTGQHRTVPTNEADFETPQDLVGLIVIADGTYKNLNWGTEATIDESLPNISISNQLNDKRVFGVVSGQEEIIDGKTNYGYGTFKTVFVTEETVGRIIINSVGEGGIWVCDSNGPIENGDFISSSGILGLGMRQNDDLLHNYTVAKITQDCDFTNPEKYVEFIYNNTTYRKQFVGCTYHCG